MTTAYIGLGANLGDPPKQIRIAVRRIRRIPGVSVIALSPLYHSAAQGCPGHQPDYCNAVAKLHTTLPPRRLHKKLQKAEREVRLLCGGKPRRTCAPRFIDIDYLFHGGARLYGKVLTLPHPRLTKRAFVLRPLADITGGNFAGLRRRQQCTDALQKLHTPVNPLTAVNANAVNEVNAVNNMPVILALESGGENFSAALTNASGVILQMTTNRQQQGKSESALPLISALLRKCKTTLAHCDAFAFAAGPGKFSGLRLSCALCQAFAYAHNKPIVQVPTLAALAEHNYPANQQTKKQPSAIRQTTTALPAHRGHYYRADCFVDDAGLWRTKNTAIIRADETPSPMPKANHPDAAATARIATKMFAKGETTTPAKSPPQYIRQKIAQTIKERTKQRRL